MERELVLFRRQTRMEKWTEKIKGCMQLRKIGMCEVMTDKVMESGLQDMDDEGALKEKYG